MNDEANFLSERFLSEIEFWQNLQNSFAISSATPVLPFLELTVDALLRLKNVFANVNNPLQDRHNSQVIFLDDRVADELGNTRSIHITTPAIPQGMIANADTIIGDIQEMIVWFTNLISWNRKGISSSLSLSGEFGSETILDERNRLLNEVISLKRSLNKRNRKVKVLRKKVREQAIKLERILSKTSKKRTKRRSHRGQGP